MERFGSSRHQETVKAKCMICGRIDDLYWMEPINTGRRTRYECSKCYALGQKEVKAMKPKYYPQYKKKKNDR